METNSSGEDLLFKARKPYTITKQRERWTEDEHNKFLEALKLYGRAWQRIEEHVGTKTAVQIRSHAQKFFTKLEKEAVNKGGNEIDIPPPRPKRKPSCPYPRKSKGISVNFHPLNVDFSKPKLLPPSSASLFSCRDETACTDLDAPREKKMTSEKQHANEVSESGACSEIFTLFKDVPCASNSSVNRTSPVKLETIAKKKKNKSPLEDQTLKESTETPKEKEPNTEPNPKPIKDADNLIGSNPIEIQQPVHTNYPPFLHNYPQFSPYLPNCHCNNDNNNTSSVFLNLLISNLVQNPAVHAAARLAASYWTPPVENETNAMDPASLAAIATATVAAASSWWAAQGLLPLYPTFPFMASPQSQMNLGEQNNTDKEDNSGVVNDPSKENGSCSNENMATEKNDIIHVNVVNKVNEQVDTNNNNNNNVKKKNDPSSCGSNTPSCSDVETDNILENLQNEPSCDNENFEGSFDNGKRGGRSSKEVSEEGRLAFQALFKRHILPQSFSPPHLKKNGEEREEMRDGTGVVELAVDLNKNADVIYPFTLAQGVDLYARLKGRRMGFKPYKRCSAEVKENRGTAGEETPCNKRIRLESETAQ